MIPANISRSAQDVSFMLEKFQRDTPGVEQAVGVSSDGLIIALATQMPREVTEKLAASVSGMTSLAHSAGAMVNKGGLAQVIVEYADGYLVTSLIKDRTALGVITSADCDLGIVGYETTMLVQRIGEILTPELITELKAAMIQ